MRAEQQVVRASAGAAVRTPPGARPAPGRRSGAEVRGRRPAGRPLQRPGRAAANASAAVGVVGEHVHRRAGRGEQDGVAGLGPGRGGARRRRPSHGSSRRCGTTSTTGTSGACRASAAAISARSRAEQHDAAEPVADGRGDQLVEVGALDQPAGDPHHRVVRRAASARRRAGWSPWSRRRSDAARPRRRRRCGAPPGRKPAARRRTAAGGDAVRAGERRRGQRVGDVVRRDGTDVVDARQLLRRRRVGRRRTPGRRAGRRRRRASTAPARRA